MIRLLIVDDQKTIRESLRLMLMSTPDIQVIGTANDGYMALEQVEILKPDVVLIDMEMPGLDGLSATRMIRQRFPMIKVMVLSIHDSDDYIAQALQAGAMGYLLKNTPAKELQESIRFIHLGYAQFGPGVVEKAMPLQSPLHIPSPPPPSRNGRPHPVSSSPSRNGRPHPVSSSPSRNGRPHPVSSSPRRPLNTPSPQPPVVENLKFNGNMMDFRVPEPSLMDQALMDQALNPPSSSPLTRTSSTLSAHNNTILSTPVITPKLSWWWYLLFGILGNVAIWGTGLAYLWGTPPTYTSQWTIALPGSSSSTNISLPEVGEASSHSDSPFSSNTSDPRENYKFLMESDIVLEMAAQQLQTSKPELGSPGTKILANTTLMQFSIDGPSGFKAQQKAIALQKGLSTRIQQLQESEVTQKDSSLQIAYEEAREKLNITQKRLADFKASSGLGSNDPIQDLTTNIEGLRRQDSETRARLEEVSANLRQLSSSINLSPQQAIDAVSLKADPLFQNYQVAFGNANSALLDLTSQLSESHPSVLNKREELLKAQTKLQGQAQVLLGRTISPSELSQLSLETGVGNSERSALFQQLIQLRGEESGLMAQSKELKVQIQSLEVRLADLTQKAAQLTSLQRDAQRAEAVYSSTATRLDLSNTSQSASYPPITVVTHPNLPEEPSSPKTKLALAGMLLSSLLISAAFLLLILRQRRLLRQSRASSSLEYGAIASLREG